MKNFLRAFFFVVTVGGCIHTDETRQSFITVAPEPTIEAWWLRAEFHPSQTEVRGIPIQAIRKTWCKASEFRRELFPADFQKDVQRASFAVDGFFDGSKIKQTALVGAYESCSGEKGTFLLVIGWPRQGPPTIRFVQELPTKHQFAVVKALPDATILVVECMDCGNYTRYKWDRSNREFVWVAD